MQKALSKLVRKGHLEEHQADAMLGALKEMHDGDRRQNREGHAESSGRDDEARIVGQKNSPGRLPEGIISEEEGRKKVLKRGDASGPKMPKAKAGARLSRPANSAKKTAP